MSLKKEFANILICGDFCPQNKLEHNLLKMNKPELIFGKFLTLIEKSDLSILNVECPLTKSEKKISKSGPNLKADPGIIRTIKNAGYSLVTLANNHIYDYGEEGLNDTQHLCDKNGINYVGVGKNLREAKKPYKKKINDKNIAVINFAENEFASSTKTNGGTNPLDIVDNCQQIIEAKKNSDCIIVIIHGGHELYHYPSPRMVNQYKFLVDCGASAVISHHSHCISGYEVYKGAPIFYGLGNFLFNSDTDFNGWYEGYAVGLNISNIVDFEIYPYKQSLKGVDLLGGREKGIMINSINDLSNVIADPAKLDKKWNEFVESRQDAYMLTALRINRYLWKICTTLGLGKKIINLLATDRLYNTIRCEAHRDILLEAFNKTMNDKSK